MKIQYFINVSFCLFLLWTVVACEKEGVDEQDIEVPEGYALSAGISTIFLNSSKAYDTPADWLSGNYASRFNRGDKLYDDVRTTDNSYGGGLGPVYAGYSCGSCHRNAGRTRPTLWSGGGSGSYGFSSMLVYISRKNGAFFQDYGRVLHDQAIYGVKPEGKLSVTYAYETFRFPDGEEYELCKPTYTISEWYADSIRPEDLFCTVRIPLRHVGMGQIMALDRTEIEALAAKSNYPEYGISGRCNYINERGILSLGVSGNKAQHADLTVELGFSSDMGVTNSRYPEEICEGQAQVNQGSMMGLTYDQLDVSTEDMENVLEHMQRKYPNLPVVLGGFSFGTYVQSRLQQQMVLKGNPPEGMVFVSTTAGKWAVEKVPENTLLIHGEMDEVVPLSDVFNWARPQDLSVVVVAGADHLFNHKLHHIRRIITTAFKNRQEAGNF